MLTPDPAHLPDGGLCRSNQSEVDFSQRAMIAIFPKRDAAVPGITFSPVDLKLSGTMSNPIASANLRTTGLIG